MDRQDVKTQTVIQETTMYHLYFYAEHEGDNPTLHPTMMTESQAKNCLGGKFVWGKFGDLGVQFNRIVTPPVKADKDVN